MIILELILCFMIFLKICCFLTTKFLYSLIAYLTERSISVSIFFHQQVCMEILFFLNMDICKYHLSCFNRKNNLLKIGSFCVCVYDPMNCSLPGSFVPGISQARILNEDRVFDSQAFPHKTL